MDMILTCEECNAQIRGEESRALMLKIQMLNHIEREHPSLAEQYKEVVDESRVRLEQEY